MNTLQEQKMPDIPPMPMLPEILQSAMPIPIPQMTYGDGMIGNFFGNWKRKQIARSKQFEAETAEYANREITAKLNTVHDIITFGHRYKDTIEEYEHKSVMRKSEQYKIQLENQILFFQAKNEEMDYKIKNKSFEEQYGTEQT